jgi:IMP dehydrogenase/GMP reductase
MQAMFMVFFLFLLCADGQQSSSSLDVSPQEDEYRCFSHEELTDSDSLSDDGNCRDTTGARGIVNPNYPGFQHLADQLHQSDTDDTEEEGYTGSNNNYNNNNNNNEDEDNNCFDNVTESKIDSVNHLDSIENFQKAFYDKPKFNIPVDSDFCSDGGSDSILVPDYEKDLNVHLPVSDIIVTEDSEKIVINTEEAESGAESESEILVTNMAAIAVSSNNIGTSRVVESQQITCSKMSDAFLSGAKEDLLGKGSADDGNTRSKCQEVMSTREAVGQYACLNMEDSNRVLDQWEDEEKAVEKFSKEEQTANEKEKDEDSVVPRKKEKMEINYSVKKNRSNSCTSKMELQKASSAPVPQQEEQGGAVVRRRDFGPRSGRDHMLANRRSVPTAARDKKPSSTEILGRYC